MANATVDLQFLARQGGQILGELRDMRRELADMRDDRTVMVAMLDRLDAGQNSLNAEVRAMRSQFDRLRNDVRGDIRERLEALEKAASST